jgi:hypothetical protein
LRYRDKIDIDKSKFVAVHALKASRGRGVIAPLMLNLGGKLQAPAALHPGKDLRPYEQGTLSAPQLLRILPTRELFPHNKYKHKDPKEM